MSRQQSRAEMAAFSFALTWLYSSVLFARKLLLRDSSGPSTKLGVGGRYKCAGSCPQRGAVRQTQISTQSYNTKL